MKLLKAIDVKKMTQLSRATIYQLAKKEFIPCVKIPGPGGKDCIRFKEDDIRAFVEKNYNGN